MKVVGLIGWSGSGKTTLLVELLRLLTAQGVRVSTMKHAHHDFDIDKPGKDSYRHREAGASEVLLISDRRWVLMSELRGAPQPDFDELMGHMAPVDLLLIEGFKAHPHDKIEIHRPELGKPMLWPNDDRIIAVASDQRLDGMPLPLLDLNDAPAIVRFILAHVGLA